MRVSLYAKNDLLFQDFREKLFSPVFFLLKKMSLSPIHLTCGSFLCGVSIMLLIQRSLSFAAIALSMHLLLDMMDGAYARYLKQSSNRGALFDIGSDLVALALFVGGLIIVKIIPLLLGLFFVVIYASSIALLIARNFLSIPPQYPLRMRIVVYASYFLLVLFSVNIMVPILFLSTLVMIISLILDVIAVVKKI